jgi:type VI secretion system protein ImpH
MDHEKGATSYSLTQRLQQKPYELDFFQAVRRLECAHPELPRVGRAQRPQGDLVRFSQNVSLAFSGCSVQAFYEATSEHPRRMMVNFLGLLGTNGPMPLSITEYVYDRLHNCRDRTLASFLDIFNHRMICLFYRAWACTRQTASYDRQAEDKFASYVGSLFGIGDDSFRNRDAIPDGAKFHFSGRLVCHSRNAEGLKQILQSYFALTAGIEEFVGQWIELPEEYRCRLGKSVESSKLGSTLVVGSRFWECQQKFRIKFGPMGFRDYQRLLPGGDSVRRIAAWVRNYVGDEFNWELQLILRRQEVPAIHLGKTGQLGWSTWLGSKRFEEDVGSLVLRNLAL